VITVAVDGRCLNTAHVRGMGKALLRLLREASGSNEFAFELYGDEPRAPLLAPPGCHVSTRVWEQRGHRFHAWEQLGLPWAAWRRGASVLHAFGTWAPAWQPVPTVVTVHDTLPWTEEPPSTYLTRVLPAAYRRAAAIITPSRSSARDIVALWPEVQNRVTVIPWGIDAPYFDTPDAPLPASLRDAGVRGPYLLYFGGRIPRKRLEWAISVWSALASDDTELALVVCGLEAESRAEWTRRVSDGLRSRFICLDFVDEAALPSVYAAAAAVLYPTLYEGFGFPALESQAVGTPVLFSALGSLAELAGPDAIVLPPDDLDAWVAAVRHVRTEGRRERTAGREWARGFSWASAWGKLASVYRRVAG
jgi:glycosyltransferase involved in cell wall biosynthesis